MKKKFNKDLLNEEIKRFKLLNEYDFYIGEEGDKVDGDIDKLMLDEDPLDNELPDDLPPDDSNTSNGDDISDLDDNGDEVPADDFDGAELPNDDLTNNTPPDDNMNQEPANIGGEDMPADDEVELDVTELVQGTEEAKQSADMANQKLDNLMSMLDQLDNRISSMDGIAAKIDNLENELEKRAPTPEEKLEMRSLDSYPYNLKLTDFWSQKEGQYDIMGVNDKEQKPKEYVLTKDDVDSDYNPTSIKNTFNDDSEYEEEDIY